MRQPSLQIGRCLTLCSEDKRIRLRESVLKWYQANGRHFPWRQTSDPLHILLAECLLRQTQATRLRKPYLELTSRYSSADILAKANVDELRDWFRPLGLVKRADHLVQAARILVESFAGQVPRNLEALASLPGVGIYSARAILCLGFGEPYPMVDEGSGRVLRRVLGMAPLGPAYCDSRLLQVAAVMLPEASPKEFNLGLIDIASAYCHATAPACSHCPLTGICLHGEQNVNVW